MRVGYSFWGFLGPGIIDTPDGGRSHRRSLIDGLRARAHEIVFLQANRDRDEAACDLTDTYRWHAGLPDIDVLFCEWRWPIQGRNTSSCGTPGHTCDLHRQRELVDHYTHARATPTIVWDKDRRLPERSLLRGLPHVVVCEAALHPTPGAVSLLFPVADALLDAASPHALAATPRTMPLVYVGNQYDRDDAFATFFAPAARKVRHVVAGRWTHTEAWPQVTFAGRIAFPEVAALYGRALATVLLLPDRYARVGQMTQRLAETVLGGCLPIAPSTVRDIARLVPTELHVASGADVINVIDRWRALAGTTAHAELLTDCLRTLGIFRLSRQLDILDHLLSK